MTEKLSNFTCRIVFTTTYVNGHGKEIEAKDVKKVEEQLPKIVLEDSLFSQ